MSRALFMSLTLASCTGEPGQDTTPSIDSATEESEDTDTAPPAPTLDEQIAALLAAQEVPPAPLEGPGDQDPALVALGEALFFDPILSGNKDVACASCHHPEHGTSDGLVLTLGTGAEGVGPARAEGEHGAWLHRHSPSLFNVGEPGQTSWFWDGRVYEGEDGPASTLGALPEGLTSALAAQALHPLLDAGEMLGQPGDTAVDGSSNELAGLSEPEAIWAAIIERLRVHEGYQELFAAAWPDTAIEDWQIQQAANALAAYQAETFQARDTPWDAYLAGDLTALDDAQKLGVLVFFGGAGCGNCHHGPLLSDGEFHNTGVPQVGPGVGDAAPYDHGREGVTGEAGDRFAFKTSPLRNLGYSAPYMHDGVFADAEAVVLHYAEPAVSAAEYDTSNLSDDLAAMVHQDEAHLVELVAALSSDLPENGDEAFVGLSNLRQFLSALDDPAWEDASPLVPETVPSGLEVPR